MRVAPNIYQTPYGWRVYVSRHGKLKPVRFKPDATIEELVHFRDAFKLESKRLRLARKRAEGPQPRGRFADDAKRYLALNVVKAMPSYTDRTREVQRWVKVFGPRVRSSLAPREINEQLQAWRSAGASGSSVNKYRTALMSLFTVLDGRSAANPVRDTAVFEETRAESRAQPYELLERILNAVPADRTRPTKGKKGSAKGGSKSRVRLELMAWTGMAPVQMKGLQPEHFSVKERWYVSPPRRKGSRRRHPRPLVRKPMPRRAIAVFKRFAELECWGDFSTRSLRHTWMRAHKKVEKAMRKELNDPEFTLPRIRIYDLRHSFATELLRQTGSLDLVGEMLDHTSRETTKRYSLGAVPAMLKTGVRKFDAATRKRRGGRR